MVDSPSPFCTAGGEPLHLAGLYSGPAFIVLAGPSLHDLDLSLLRQRGVFSIGINNSPSLIRTNAWTCVDRHRKFLDSIWRDPGVLKFANVRKAGAHLRRKLPDGRFEQLTDDDGRHLTVRDMPGVIFTKRNGRFDPSAYLDEPSINCGNRRRASQFNGWPHCIDVMFCVLKLTYALGFRTAYLLGCDFSMSNCEPYAFDQDKHAGGVEANNGAYRLMAEMLGALRPRFDAAGFRVLNCNPHSRLTVFDFCDFNSAIDHATGNVQQMPDVAGWYDDD